MLLYGDGQLAHGVARQLARRTDVSVTGPVSRSPEALASGADVVVIATTTLLAEVADSVEAAVRAGSNVIVSAEEAAYPWVVNQALSERIDALALDRGVTVIGGGLNPGFLFDAYVLTLLGVHAQPSEIQIKRVVDLSHFGPAVRARLGLGFTPSEFASGLERGEILGHAGFSQSMHIVSDAIGIPIDRIDVEFVALFASRDHAMKGYRIPTGDTAGIHHMYSASAGSDVWFTADFVGHVDLAGEGMHPTDTVTIVDEFGSSTATIDPGVASQEGSASMIANSIDRVIDGPAGWVSVAQLPPAYPRLRRKSPQ